MDKSSGYGDQSIRRRVNLSKSSQRSSRLGSARALSNHKSPLVSRLVQPILTNKWYQKEIQKKEEKEIEGCTFKPKISARSNDKNSSVIKSTSNLHSREKPLEIFKKANLNYNRRKYSRQSIDVQQEARAAQDSGRCGSHNQPSERSGQLKVDPLDLTKIMQQQDPRKFKSKDLMESTGNKFHDLYLLSQKIDFLKPRRDKSTNEIEYELYREECSFQPNT